MNNYWFRNFHFTFIIAWGMNSANTKHQTLYINWVSYAFSAFECEFLSPHRTHHSMPGIAKIFDFHEIAIKIKIHNITARNQAKRRKRKRKRLSPCKWIIGAWTDTTMPLSPLWAGVRDIYSQFDQFACCAHVFRILYFCTQNFTISSNK